uniref:Glycerol-3-phosphate acyltransferase 2, mitochondrial n=1 Tax=Tetraodon nigroviridis TaxID=99883 RepID=H3BXE6_TETNG
LSSQILSRAQGKNRYRHHSEKLSWEFKIKKKMITVPPCLGKSRPIVGECCSRCTPDSLSMFLKLNLDLSFQNLLRVRETQTRYRGWLARRVCCILFVMGCKNYTVREALAAEQKGDGQGQRNGLSSFLPLINTCITPALSRCVHHLSAHYPLLTRFVGWALLKMFSSTFDNIQVNLSHLAALHKASKQEGPPLLYVHVRQSFVDFALISLVLFCHNLRLPYIICPLPIKGRCLRTILQKLGVILLPPSALTEQDAEKDRLYSPVMNSLLGELLREGQPLSVGVSAEPGQGGQWLAYITHLVKEASVTDVSVVPVGISYDRAPKTSMPVGVGSVLLWLWSSVWRKWRGSVRIHFAQPFSLKEMCALERWTVDKWRPLQELLLPVVLDKRLSSITVNTAQGKKKEKALLLLFMDLEVDKMGCLVEGVCCSALKAATSCTAVMSTSLVSSLLLHRHRKGVTVSLLCRDVVWLTEEVLFRKKDVGFGGSVTQVVHYSLTLLAPYLIMAAAPSRKDAFIVPHPSLSATLHLSNQAKIITHTFILEAVGGCRVCWVQACEIKEKGKGDMDFDVVLCQSELMERALQLCRLLPPGFLPPCQSSQSFALDAVDSLVRCGILVMEEIVPDVPVCDVLKKSRLQMWAASDEPYHSESDGEEQEPYSYRISQPSRCPEMIFFLCSMLAGHLRSLCWTTAGLEFLHTPLPSFSSPAAGAEFVAQILSHLRDTANQKSCSEEAAHTAVRTLVDLGVLLEETRGGDGVILEVSPQFQQAENRLTLTRYISQYLYN